MKHQNKAAALTAIRGAANHTTTRVQFSDTTLAAQRARLLAALSKGSLTTIDIRYGLDILHPAGRVLELRRRGHDIMLTWVHRPTDSGAIHRVGLYTLMPRRSGGRHAQ
jgi:hypothetical protein